MANTYDPTTGAYTIDGVEYPADEERIPMLGVDAFFIHETAIDHTLTEAYPDFGRMLVEPSDCKDGDAIMSAVVDDAVASFIIAGHALGQPVEVKIAALEVIRDAMDGLDRAIALLSSL